MCRQNKKQPKFENFHLTFEGRLRSNNRWVKPAKQIPWQEIENVHCSSLSGTSQVSPPLSARIALGALIIKERLGSAMKKRWNRFGRIHIYSSFRDSNNAKTKPFFIRRCPCSLENAFLLKPWLGSMNWSPKRRWKEHLTKTRKTIATMMMHPARSQKPEPINIEPGKSF